jgi:ribosome-binding protein aMBF1 (putative translation factor)
MAISAGFASLRFAHIVKTRRRQVRKNPEDLADQLGVEVSFIHGVERGDIMNTRRSLLKKLIRVLQLKKRNHGRAFQLLNVIAPEQRNDFPKRTVNHGSMNCLRR